MQYTDEEIPCSLFLIRAGSRRIIASQTNGQSLTWWLQVPPKSGCNSVPIFISAPKVSLNQMSVSYLNADKTIAVMPNGSSLHVQSATNRSDIGTFPPHVPAQILQVSINGLPTPSSANILEVHMIICYEATTQIQVRYSDWHILCRNSRHSKTRLISILPAHD